MTGIECTMPHLGLATTKELIDELAARAAVDASNGEPWTFYSTVGGRDPGGSGRFLSFDPERLPVRAKLTTESGEDT